MTATRGILCGLLLAALVAAGVARLATRDAASSIEADLAAAEAALRQGDAARATALARGVLEREPATGRAFGILARARGGDASDPAHRALLETAARRAPRDRGVRAGLAAQALQDGDFATAVDHLDALLTVAPDQRRELLELVATLAQDPGFADALADHLQQRPQHRAAILRTAASRGPGEAADRIHGALRARGGLSPAETARWLDGLLRDGRWGSAYAYWASAVDAPAGRLPVPWNGDFGHNPTGSGFDWRLRRTPGVVFDRIALEAGGHALRIRFLGRPVGRTGLEVPLLLAPGDHTLRLRVRTRDLRSDQGLAWTLACSDGRTRIGEGARVREAAGWTSLSLDFSVPAEGCEGQWLRLVNPAPRGVAQSLRGELQLTGVSIAPRDAGAGAGDSTTAD